MADLLRLFGDISTFLKLAWAGWLVWGTVQVVWYCRARVLPAAPEPLSRDRSAERRPASALKLLEPAPANVADAVASAPAVGSQSSETVALPRKSKRERRQAASSSSAVFGLTGTVSTVAESEPS
jgi:hypothetical protein